MAKTLGTDPVEVLRAIQKAVFAQDLTQGKILVGTSEAGGSATFQIPAGHTPLEIADLCQAAIDRLQGRRQIRRLTASFRHATL